MNGRTVAMVSWLVALTSLAALAEEGAVAGRAAGAAPVYKAGPASGTPQPFLKQLSLSKAADYLDAGAHAYEKGCFACHATFAYLAARPAISPASAAYCETRKALEHFIADLPSPKADHNATPPLEVAKTVMTAAALARDDAALRGTLHPLTRKALDRIWDLQRADGGWNWPKLNAPPSEIDDHFGVTTAAIAVAAAPEGYANTERAHQGLERVRNYLRAHPSANMHQRGMLLLAARHLQGLITDQQRKQTTSDLLALQQPDGGWCMAGLADWKRVDGKALDRTASDGYGTGFAVYALRHGAAIPVVDPRLSKAVSWLKTHQCADGSWFTRSPHKDDRLSTYTGTAFAVLALAACGETSVLASQPPRPLHRP